MRVLVNNIFKGRNFLWNQLRNNLEIKNDRKLVQPLEYAKATTIQYTAKGGTVALKDEEIVTDAEYTPSMINGSMVIFKQDELINTSDMAVLRLLDIKTSNLQASIEEFLANDIFVRATNGAVTTPNGWNSIDHLINNHATAAVGGIPSSGNQASWWKSQVVTLTTDAYYAGSDPSVEANLLDPTQKVYLLKILYRIIALGNNNTGKIDLILVPPYIKALLKIIFNDRKMYITDNKRAASLGFTVLDYEGVAIEEDRNLAANQTGDTDGWMYGFSMKYMKMFLNDGAKFTAGEFVQDNTINAKSSLVNGFGNIGVSNRAGHVVVKNVRSVKTYAISAN